MELFSIDNFPVWSQTTANRLLEHLFLRGFPRWKGEPEDRLYISPYGDRVV